MILDNLVQIVIIIIFSLFFYEKDDENSWIDENTDNEVK